MAKALLSQVDEMGFPPDFQEYKREQKVTSGKWGCEVKYWLLQSADNEEPEHPPGFSCSSGELKKKIKILLEEFMELNFPRFVYWGVSRIPSLLIQFWEPVLIEGRTLLTTRHQPFAINSKYEGLCRYRVISESYKFYVDERRIKDELGLLGRVFIHKLPECSPDIEYYTIKEYPQRQDALGCQITGVNAYPVLDPSRQSCVGVLEIVMSGCGYQYFDCNIPSKEEDLKILDLAKHSRWPTGDDDEDFKAAKKEINEVLKNVREAHKLYLAQVWAVCGVCMSNASYTGQLISMVDIQFEEEYDFDDITYACESFHFQEGQGLVGQALSSKGLIFCSDITQFSIVDYPLAHFAKYDELRSSFAICVQSSRTGSHLYVLEFFLHSSLEINESLMMLHCILGLMKLHFQNFKLASGKDWGEKLPIQVVDYRNGEKCDCYTLEVEFLITRSPQSPPGNGASKILERPESKTGIQLGLNDILPHRKKNIADAAEALGVSRSTLKRICREHNINRWPPRNIKENCSLSQGDNDGQQILHPSSNQVLPTITPTNSHDTMMLDVNFVNVKAKHINDVIKFKLLLSSGLAELQYEIAKRLKLTGGTYDIKYEDEEKDLVLITCDEDVQDWINTCGSQGSNSLKVFLMLK